MSRTDRTITMGAPASQSHAAALVRVLAAMAQHHLAVKAQQNNISTIGTGLHASAEEGGRK